MIHPDLPVERVAIGGRDFTPEPGETQRALLARAVRAWADVEGVGPGTLVMSLTSAESWAGDPSHFQCFASITRVPAEGGGDGERGSTAARTVMIDLYYGRTAEVGVPRATLGNWARQLEDLAAAMAATDPGRATSAHTLATEIALWTCRNDDDGPTLHRYCDWPGCQAIWRTIWHAYRGDPGWKQSRRLRLCPEHADTPHWADYTVGADGQVDGALCSCGHRWEEAPVTLAVLKAWWQQHVATAEART